MPVELIGFALSAASLVALALYMDRHRAEDAKKNEKEDPDNGPERL